MVYVDDERKIARLASQYSQAEGFTLAGLILMGYGDIPANTPFWCTIQGPAIAKAEKTA